MREVRESNQAGQELDAIHASGRSNLIDKVEDAFEWIESGDARAKRARFDSSPLDPDGVWIIELCDQGEDWLLAWSDAPTLGSDIAVVHTVRKARAPRGR